MLIAHKIIDALRCQRGLVLPTVAPSKISAAARKIDDAQKFDFGDLNFEKQEAPGHWHIPHLTDDERVWWAESLLPLPFPICWFEYVLGNSRSGLLVEELGDGWAIQRFDWIVGQRVLYDGVIVFADKRKSMGHQLEVIASGDEISLKTEELRYNVASGVPLAIYLNLMLSSRTTETRIVSAPRMINKQRARKGKCPISAHRVVVIVPDRFRERKDPQGGTHASPALHWRRSHIRHLDRETPHSVWAPEIMHLGRKGWWVIVVPRCLVGKAEHGEITHDYFVRNDAQRKPQVAT